MESTEMSRIIFSLRSFDRLSPHSIRIGQFDPVAYSRSANGQSIGASQSRWPRRATHEIFGEFKDYLSVHAQTPRQSE
jgi:hypothetical protein